MKIHIDFEKIPQRVHIVGYCITRGVYINGEKLYPDESQKVWNHSPDGFNWGYGGSGPAQLSLAILLKFLPQDASVFLHTAFKFAFVAELPIDKDFDVILNLREQISHIFEKLIKRHNESI